MIANVWKLWREVGPFLWLGQSVSSLASSAAKQEEQHKARETPSISTCLPCGWKAAGRCLVSSQGSYVNEADPAAERKDKRNDLSYLSILKYSCKLCYDFVDLWRLQRFQINNVTTPGAILIL